jgi:hypothetical protein
MPNISIVIPNGLIGGTAFVGGMGPGLYFSAHVHDILERAAQPEVVSSSQDEVNNHGAQSYNLL